MAIDFSELRRAMVDNQIRTVDVTKLPILSAFLTVPREKFVPKEYIDFSYLDTDIKLNFADNNELARYLMAPAPLAKLLQAALISPDDVVLDIGAGTGYTAALVSNLAASIIALESDRTLFETATQNLSENYDNVAVIQNDLNSGYADEAPYNVILIEGAVDYIPVTIFDQLKEGGRLVAVEGHGNAGVAKVFVKEKGHVSSRYAFNLAVKPLIGFLNETKFVF